MADEPVVTDEETIETPGVTGAADDERRRRALAALAVVIILVLVLLLLWMRPPGRTENAGSESVVTGPSAVATRPVPAAVIATNVVVPDVVGTLEPEGRVKLSNSGLGASTEWIEAGEPEGTIVNQFPGAGVEVEPGTVVELTVSTGLAGGGTGGGPTVPNVLGLSAAEARAKLGAKGWSCTVVSGPSTTTRAGIVFYQNPGAGDHAGSSRHIRIWVSTGSPKTGFPYPRPEN